MKLLLKLTLITLLFSTNSNAQQWEWVRQIQGGANDTGFSIDVDNDGSVFVVGRCKGPVLFEDETDPIGPLTIGDRDAFISKYDKDGNLLWATIAGGIPDDYDIAQSVKGDNEGGCYVTGFFNNESYFGDDTIVSNGFRDVFLSRLNEDGEFIWTKSFGGTAEDNGFGVTVDNEGNPLICGRVNGVVDVEGTSIGTVGQYNAFIGKYDSDGNFVEIHDFHSPYKSNAQNIEVDTDGNIYVCGGLNGNCVYEGMTLLTGHSASWDDAFLLKCNPDFSPDWFQSGGGNFYDIGLDLAISENKVYMSGTYGGIALFDTIPITYNSSATGTLGTLSARDMFIASYDKSSGDIQWLLGAGNEGIDEASGIVVSENDEVYFSGYFRDSISFSDTTVFSSGLNSTDIVTGKLDSLGNLIWLKETGNIYLNRSFGITIDEHENIFITGDFNNLVLFDDVSHVAIARDAFGGKLTQHPAPNFTLNDTAFCMGDTLIINLDGITSPLTYSYSSTDGYSHWMDSTHIYYIITDEPSMDIEGFVFATNSLYTDSILIDTTISVSIIPTITLAADTASCISPILLSVEDTYSDYNWDDMSYTHELEVYSSGLYHVFVQNDLGCSITDSILVTFGGDFIIGLPIDTSACNELTYTVSDEYTSYDWNDGLDLDNEITITSSGVYYLEITDSIGCSKIDSMEVVIFTSPTPVLGGDTLICDYDTFTITTEDIFETYTWSTGETGSNEIIVSTTGTYEVTVTDDNECSGSNTITVTFTDCAGIDEITSELSLIYNFNNNTIKNNSDLPIKNLIITSLDGKILMRIENLNSGESVQLDHLSAAFYLVYTLDDRTKSPIKIFVGE